MTTEHSPPQDAQFTQTPLTRVRRTAKRADYSHAAVYEALDHTYVCHVAFSVDGQPHCIPTAHWRIGDTLYIHGSNGSRMMRALAEGAPVSIAVTIVDGLVLARSVFHHSMNYRSAMVYGQFHPVTDGQEKELAMRAFLDKIETNRWGPARPPNSKEYAATTILAIKIEEAVAKTRTGPPIDDVEDMSQPVWAGVLPIETHMGMPIRDLSHEQADAQTSQKETA